MRLYIFLLFYLCSYYSIAQIQAWSGTYKHGTSPDSGATGQLLIYPTNDTQATFRLDLCRCAPSYNTGAIVGQITLQNDSAGVFSITDSANFINCSLTFIKRGNLIEIKTTEKNDECGYGFGVYSQGIFELTDPSTPMEFITREGEVIKFESYDWKTWWNWLE